MFWTIGEKKYTAENLEKLLETFAGMDFVLETSKIPKEKMFWWGRLERNERKKFCKENRAELSVTEAGKKYVLKKWKEEWENELIKLKEDEAEYQRLQKEAEEKRVEAEKKIEEAKKAASVAPLPPFVVVVTETTVTMVGKEPMWVGWWAVGWWAAAKEAAKSKEAEKAAEAKVRLAVNRWNNFWTDRGLELSRQNKELITEMKPIPDKDDWKRFWDDIEKNFWEKHGKKVSKTKIWKEFWEKHELKFFEENFDELSETNAWKEFVLKSWKDLKTEEKKKFALKYWGKLSGN
jgi:hypothetical protein